MPNLAHNLQEFPNSQKIFIFIHEYFIRVLSGTAAGGGCAALTISLTRPFSTRMNDPTRAAQATPRPSSRWLKFFFFHEILRPRPAPAPSTSVRRRRRPTLKCEWLWSGGAQT